MKAYRTHQNPLERKSRTHKKDKRIEHKRARQQMKYGYSPFEDSMDYHQSFA